MSLVYIYTLECPLNNEVRYIGKTNNLEVRFKNHINRSHNKSTHKTNWIESLKNQDLKPIIKILDEVDSKEWKYWEKFWINQFLAWGFNLVNHTEGGDGLTFGNRTSFKKGHRPWNYGTRNKSNCCVCDKEFYITKSDLNRGRCCCSIKCASKKRIGHENTQFKKGQESLRKKKVFQYSKDKLKFLNEFPSVREASKSLGINEIAIARCCRNISKSSGGFYWSYTKLNN